MHAEDIQMMWCQHMHMPGPVCVLPYDSAWQWQFMTHGLAVFFMSVAFIAAVFRGSC